MLTEMLGEGRQVFYAPNLLLAVLTYLYIVRGLYDLNKISSKKKMYRQYNIFPR